MKDYKLVGSVRKYQSKGRESRNYMQKFKILGETKVRIVSLGVPNKEVAERHRDEKIKKKIEKLQTKNDPHFRTTTNKIQKPLAEYIENHRKQGNTGKQSNEVESRIKRVIKALGPEKYEHLDPVNVENYIAGLNVSIATKNHYIENMKSWSLWMYTKGRWPNHKLVTLSKYAKKSVKSFGILTTAQIKALSIYLETAPDIRNLSGKDRDWLYQIASQTGLRASELSQLTPCMFHLDGEFPFVELPAEYSKRGKRTGEADVILMSNAFGDKLRPWIENLAPTQIWGHSKSWSYKAVQLLRLDLAGAGIPSKVGSAEINFHSFRRYFITQLCRSGVSRSVIMKAARLSSEKLLDGYAKFADSEVASLVNSLPMVE